MSKMSTKSRTHGTKNTQLARNRRTHGTAQAHMEEPPQQLLFSPTTPSANLLLIDEHTEKAPLLQHKHHLLQPATPSAQLHMQPEEPLLMPARTLRITSPAADYTQLILFYSWRTLRTSLQDSSKHSKRAPTHNKTAPPRSPKNCRKTRNLRETDEHTEKGTRFRPP